MATKLLPGSHDRSIYIIVGFVSPRKSPFIRVFREERHRRSVLRVEEGGSTGSRDGCAQRGFAPASAWVDVWGGVGTLLGASVGWEEEFFSSNGGPRRGLFPVGLGLERGSGGGRRGRALMSGLGAVVAFPSSISGRSALGWESGSMWRSPLPWNQPLLLLLMT